MEGVKFDDLPEARRYQDTRSESSEGDNGSSRSDLVEESDQPKDLEQGGTATASSKVSTKSSPTKDVEPAGTTVTLEHPAADISQST